MSDRMNYVTFLKGVAILGVVLAHAPLAIDGVSLIIKELCHVGAFGCQLFFVVSGFLMVQSWERIAATHTTFRDAYLGFIKKRYLSIAPIYVVFIAFYQIVAGVIKVCGVSPFYPIAQNMGSVIANVFLLHGLDFNNFNFIVPGGWFIGTIFLFYLLFPFVYKVYGQLRAIRPQRLIYLPLGAVCLSVVVHVICYLIEGNWSISRPGGWLYYSIINQFPCMLFGVILNDKLSERKKRASYYGGMFLGVGFLVIALWYIFRLHYWIYAIVPYLLGVAFMYFFLLVYHEYNTVAKICIRGDRIVEKCGKFSFAAYFTNFIAAFMFPWGVQLCLKAWHIPYNGNWLFLILCVPIFVLTFWLAPLVEKNIVWLKKCFNNYQ